MADLKRVYAAVDENTALRELDRFDEILGRKYTKITDNCHNKWVYLSTYFNEKGDYAMATNYQEFMQQSLLYIYINKKSAKCMIFAPSTLHDARSSSVTTYFG
jgi:transposase-like protein